MSSSYESPNKDFLIAFICFFRAKYDFDYEEFEEVSADTKVARGKKI